MKANKHSLYRTFENILDLIHDGKLVGSMLPYLYNIKSECIKFLNNYSDSEVVKKFEEELNDMSLESKKYLPILKSIANIYQANWTIDGMASIFKDLSDIIHNVGNLSNNPKTIDQDFKARVMEEAQKFKEKVASPDINDTKIMIAGSANYINAMQPRAILSSSKYADIDVKLSIFLNNRDDAETVMRVLKEKMGNDIEIDYKGGYTLNFKPSVKQIHKVFDVDIIMDVKGSKSHLGNIKVLKELYKMVSAVAIGDHEVAAPKVSNGAYTYKYKDQGCEVYTAEKFPKYYNMPESSGKGINIGIVQLGGGFKVDVLNSYYSSIGVKMAHLPISVGIGVSNFNQQGSHADAEVMLDMEIIGAIAPEAKQRIYFSDASHAGFLSALDYALHDKSFKPDIISVSWGLKESYVPDSIIQAMSKLGSHAKSENIPVFIASGDNGATDSATDNILDVDCPSNIDGFISVGGTQGEVVNGKLIDDSAWDQDDKKSATGGGISRKISKPEYQMEINEMSMYKDVNKNDFIGKGIPDVAAFSYPGFCISVHGELYTQEGGTSAAAPLWAALTARMFEICPSLKQQNLLKSIYKLKGLGFHDIVKGNNGYYKAKEGYDLVTGWGTPDGKVLLENLCQERKGIAKPDGGSLTIEVVKDYINNSGMCKAESTMHKGSLEGTRYICDMTGLINEHTKDFATFSDDL